MPSNVVPSFFSDELASLPQSIHRRASKVAMKALNHERELLINFPIKPRALRSLTSVT